MKFKFLFFSFFIIFNCAKADYNLNIPIINDGRITSFNSFAKETYNNIVKNNIKISSSEWLIELMFNKNLAFKRNIFLIKNKNIISNLDIPYKKDYSYSLNDIYYYFLNKINLFLSLNSIKSYNRTKDQNEFVDLYYSFLLVLKLSSVFDFVEPNFFNIDNTNIKISEYDIIVNNFDKQKYIQNKFNYQIETNVLNNILSKIDNFYIFPINNKWINLDNIIKDDCDGLIYINKMIKAMHDNNEYDWNLEKIKLEKYYLCFLNTSENIKFKFETFYNSFSIIFISFLIYLLSFLFFAVSFLVNNFHYIGKTFFRLGFLLHFFIIIFRIFISFRAPVATLFESILFVNFIISFLLFFLINKQNNKLIVIFNLFFVSLLQYIVYRYNEESGLIKNLLPVLNTNFWLTIHVMTITIGYALCIAFSILGHILMFMIFRYGNNSTFTIKFFNLNLFFCILSISFLIIGTFLGGIWADQSWGRFWGWDPKENGALLIILWQTFILHFRFTNIFSFLFFAIFAVFSNIIVSLSWFGVNLLNVGLHSYGFIENIGQNLIKFFLFEFFFILFFLLLIFKKNKKFAF